LLALRILLKVGRAVGVPEATLVAAPSADLWDGQTDEDELGFSYDFVELFTGGYLPLDAAGQQAFRDSLKPEALTQFDTWAAVAADVNKRNSHKIGGPKNLNVMTPWYEPKP
jgi:NAD+ synthase (glutamine-hydrolysing)